VPSPDDSSAKIWAVIPAAGIGSRMALETPKQYATLNNTSIIEHSLSRLLAHPRVEGAVVVISPDDTHWQSLSIEHDKPILVVEGGKARCDSVLNGLLKLEQQLSADDWVLVHDAARPCVRVADIDALITQCGQHPVGGILAAEVSDTMKRATPHLDIVETVDRKQLWRAFTPQMFRLGILKTALEQAKNNGETVTDEASAIELNNLVPKLVAGSSDNIKVTRIEDLALAEFYLNKQAQEK